jgi:hypothetical protein
MQLKYGQKPLWPMNNQACIGAGRVPSCRFSCNPYSFVIIVSSLTLNRLLWPMGWGCDSSQTRRAFQLLPCWMNRAPRTWLEDPCVKSHRLPSLICERKRYPTEIRHPCATTFQQNPIACKACSEKAGMYERLSCPSWWWRKPSPCWILLQSC